MCKSEYLFMLRLIIPSSILVCRLEFFPFEVKPELSNVCMNLDEFEECGLFSFEFT